MAWLATGSYQSKPTASMPRGPRRRVHGVDDAARGAGGASLPRNRAQAAPRPGSRTAPYGDTAAKNRRITASPAWRGGKAASCTVRRSST